MKKNHNSYKKQLTIVIPFLIHVKNIFLRSQKLYIIYITLLYNSYFTKTVIKRANFYLKIKEQWKIKKPIKTKLGYLSTQPDEIKF